MYRNINDNCINKAQIMEDIKEKDFASLPGATFKNKSNDSNTGTFIKQEIESIFIKQEQGITVEIDEFTGCTSKNIKQQCDVKGNDSFGDIFLKQEIDNNSVEQDELNFGNSASMNIKKKLDIEDKILPIFNTQCDTEAATGATWFTCSLCNHKCVTKRKLRYHIGYHHGSAKNPKPFSCSLCDFKSIWRRNFNNHMWRNHQPEDVKPKSTFPESGSKPQSTFREGCSKCSLCDANCVCNEAALSKKTQHTEEKSDGCISSKQSTSKKRGPKERVYSCNHCDYKYSSKSALYYHLQIYTNGKPFSCALCKRKYSVKESLLAHLKQHTGRKLYRCPLCNLGYFGRSSLIKHWSTHRSFNCSHCDYKAVTKQQLRDHNKTHPKQKFHCHICDFKGATNKDLVRHLVVHVTEKPFECCYCNCRFETEEILMKHLRETAL